MTELSRRQLLTNGCMGVAAAAAPTEALAIVRPPKQMPPDAVGMLNDSTLCIGCKACVAACKAANKMPAEIPPDLSNWNEQTWDSAEDLSGRTLNVIKVYRNGTAEKKDREVDGFAFVKRHGLHCVDPSCVSVCPVGAMRKDPVKGIVSYDPDACIGCRYCVYACPFGVPQYDFNNPFGKIAKCEFCRHLQKDGKVPACCDVCPTGASLFGTVKDLEQETARRSPHRLALPTNTHAVGLATIVRPTRRQSPITSKPSTASTKTAAPRSATSPACRSRGSDCRPYHGRPRPRSPKACSTRSISG